MCISIYIGNALLLWAGLKGLKNDERRLLDDLGGVITANAMFIVCGAFALAVLAGSLVLPNRPIEIHEASRPVDPDVDPNSTEFLAQLFSKPRGPIELDGSEAVLGSEDAPYLIVEWADYGCPHCARASLELKQLVQEFPQIQVRFKTFPLTSACNPGLDFDAGPDRCKAAMTAECARDQGKFWDLQRLLFANQGRFSDDDLAYMAKQAGVEMDGWFACMEGKEVVDGILADARAGTKAGVSGTPAMFLKGTHGDRFVEVVNAGAALRLMEVHSNGGMLPEPGPPHEH